MATGSRERRLRIAEYAVCQGGVVSRRQLYSAGVTRAEVRAHVRADRWFRRGSAALMVNPRALDATTDFWAAVFEAGPRGLLDGESALIAAGLEHYRRGRIRVSVPRGAISRRTAEVDVRQTRRLSADDADLSSLLPRTRVDVAAIRAALWAASDRQAALLLTMPVQQGLTTPDRLGVELLRIRRDKRRVLLHEVVGDLMGGVRSLGELEFARECRVRGLPEPTRQVVRRGRNGRYYLDVMWEQWGVVVEIDGIHHSWAGQVISDALRHNDVTLGNSLVLRLPLLGFRLEPDPFFAQITDALVARGCRLDRRHTA